MRTAIYVRVAVSKQKREHAIRQSPIEQQLEHLLAHVNVRGEVLVAEDIYRDEGHSGGTLDRPALNRLRTQVRLGTYDRVLAISPDRLARSYTLVSSLIKEFGRSGCRTEFLDSRVAMPESEPF